MTEDKPPKYRKTLKIKKSSLTKLQLKFGWKGTGSQEEPIIIDSIIIWL